MSSWVSTDIVQIGYFDEEEESKKVFVREHGMLAIIEALQTRRSREVIESMLRIINLVSLASLSGHASAKV